VQVHLEEDHAACSLSSLLVSYMRYKAARHRPGTVPARHALWWNADACWKGRRRLHTSRWLLRDYVGSAQSTCSVTGAPPPLAYMTFSRNRSRAGGGYTGISQ